MYVTSGQSLVISSGQTIAGVTVCQGGRLILEPYGAASDIVCLGGLYVTCARVNNVTLSALGSDGQLIIRDSYIVPTQSSFIQSHVDPQIDHVTVSNGGWLYCGTDFYPQHVKQAGGYVHIVGDDYSVDPYIHSGHVVTGEWHSNVQTYNHTATVHSGTIFRNNILACVVMVFSGGVVQSCTLGPILWGHSNLDRANLEISPGGTATGITISSGGSLNVFPPAYISNITISSGGSFIGHSSTLSATEVTVYSGAHITKWQSGGLIDGLYLKSGFGYGNELHAQLRNVHVSQGAVFRYTGNDVPTVYQQGGYVSGNNIIYMPSVISNLTPGWYDTVTVHSGTTLQDISCYCSVNRFALYSGAVINNCSGNIPFNEQCIYSNTQIAKNISIGYYSNKVFTDLQITSNYISLASGTAISATINSGGTLLLPSGTAISATINSGGTLLLPSGTAISATINSGGKLHYAQPNMYGSDLLSTIKGSIQYTDDQEKIISSGVHVVASGLNLTGFQVLSGGFLQLQPLYYVYQNLSTVVRSGGTLFYQPLASQGNVSISIDSGAVLNGNVIVTSSTVLRNLSDYIKGQFSPTSNRPYLSTYIQRAVFPFYANAGFASQAVLLTSGWYSAGHGSNIITVCSGSLSVDTKCDIQQVTLKNGGMLINVWGLPCTINSVIAHPGAYVDIRGSGKVSSLTNFGAYITPATVSRTDNFIPTTKNVLYANASATITPNLHINTAYVQGLGVVSVLSGGIIDTAFVYNGGTLSKFTGGVVSNLIQTTAPVAVYSQTDNWVYGKKLLATTDKNRMYVSSKGLAIDTIISSGGRVYVRNGGSASNTMIQSGGIFSATSGTFIEGLRVKGSNTYIKQAKDVIVYKGASINYSKGMSGVVQADGNLRNISQDMKLMPHASTYITTNVQQPVTIQSDRIVNGMRIKSELVVSDGMAIHYPSALVADNKYPKSSAILRSADTVQNVIVAPGGSLVAASGQSNIVESGGYVYLSNGASVIPNQVSGITLVGRKAATIHSNTIYSDCSILKNVSVTVSSGGLIKGCILEGQIKAQTNGYITSSGIAFVSIDRGGRAEGNIVNSGGILSCYVPAALISTTVNSGGVCLLLRGFQNVSQTSVNPGGYLNVSQRVIPGPSAVRCLGGVIEPEPDIILSDISNSFSQLQISPGCNGILYGVQIDHLIVDQEAEVAFKGSRYDSTAFVHSADVKSGGTLQQLASSGAHLISSVTVQSGGKVYAGGACTVVYSSGAFIQGNPYLVKKQPQQ